MLLRIELCSTKATEQDSRRKRWRSGNEPEWLAKNIWNAIYNTNPTAQNRNESICFRCHRKKTARMYHDDATVSRMPMFMNGAWRSNFDELCWCTWCRISRYPEVSELKYSDGEKTAVKVCENLFSGQSVYDRESKKLAIFVKFDRKLSLNREARTNQFLLSQRWRQCSDAVKTFRGTFSKTTLCLKNRPFWHRTFMCLKDRGLTQSLMYTNINRASV